MFQFKKDPFKKLTSHQNLHGLRIVGRSVNVEGFAPVNALVFVTDPGEEQRSIVECEHARPCGWIEWSSVLCPSDKLHWRRCVYVAPDHARQAQWQVLNGGRIIDTRWICTGRKSQKLLEMDKGNTFFVFCSNSIWTRLCVHLLCWTLLRN